MKSFLKLAAAATILVAGAGPALAAQKSARMTRIDGKPNLNGIWQTMSGANWDLEPHSAGPAPAAADELGAIAAIPPGLGVVEGGMIPYTPEGLVQRAANHAKAPREDPEAACYLPGIPRATYMDHPFQIIQGGGSGPMLMVYQYDAANRAIAMKPVEVPPIDTWMGTSYGSWEGDTLKVVTLAQAPGEVILPGGDIKTGVTWLDRAGNYLSNTATVTERFTLKDPDHMLYEVTIEDPAVYTRPWKISMTLYRRVEPNIEILDFRCVPFADDLLYGDLLSEKDKYPKR